MTVGRRDFLAMPMLLLARPSTDVRIEEIQRPSRITDIARRTSSVAKK